MTSTGENEDANYALDSLMGVASLKIKRRSLQDKTETRHNKLHYEFKANNMFFSKQKSGYQSEITEFIAELKKVNPQLEQSQRAGRDLLWDKAPVSLDTQARILSSTLGQGNS